MLEAAEILMDPPLVRRGQRMLEAMATTAPAGSVVTTHYTGRHRILVIYGAGRLERLRAMREHQARGGAVVAWDLGYWDREQSMRLSINSLHPKAEHLLLAPADQARASFELRNDANPDGPVMVVGLGDKSAALYGLRSMEWELAALRRIKAAHPGRAVVWRPKARKGAEELPGCKKLHGMEIEEALRGCSLVVCRHSNVAVDACIAGIPVECEDGAALALYGAGSTPSETERAEFLRRLGWWNWRPSEAAQAWNWIRKVTTCPST